MSEYYICVDLGTSKIKCSLLNEKGYLVYYSRIDAKTFYGEIVYQDAEDYFNIVLKEINNIKRSYPEKFKKTISIVISGQMGGVLGIDKDFNIIFPWTYSVDTKYNEYLYRIEKDYKSDIRKSSGGTPTMAAKILWIRDKFPEKYDKIEKFINLMSYVSCKLCGLNYKNVFIDCSCLTMSGIANIKNQTWNKELIKEFNIDINKLPQIKKANEKIGVINKNIFQTYTDIVVLAGCGDQVAGFLGAGANTKNDLIDVSGTYTILGYCSNKYIADIQYSSLHSIYSGISNIYYQIAIITAGGYTFEWFLKNFNYVKENKENNKYLVKKENLFFIPYFGGRYSPSQPYFRGGWVGMTWEHDINDLYYAILESSGFEFSYALDTIKKVNNLRSNEFKHIKIIGGGSFNDYENEIKASILNLTYYRLNNLPYELLGCFLIAKYGEKVREGHEDLIKNQIINIEKEYVPSKQMTNYYQKMVKKYSKLIFKMGEIYSEISLQNN